MKDKPNIHNLIQSLSFADEDFPEEKQGLADKFWESVIFHGGAPLIVEKNGIWTVTFLYKNKEKNLRVNLDCFDLIERLVDEKGNLACFQQIPDTDIYFLEVKNVPSQTCIPYEIEVNGHSEHDPLNPKTFQLPLYNQNTVELSSRVSSVLVVGSPPLPFWCNNKIIENKGEIVSFSIESAGYKINFGQRNLWVYKPPEFDANHSEPYRLLLILDGDTYINFTPPYLDYAVTQSNNLKHTVVAFIGNVNPQSVQERFYHDEITDHRRFEYLTNSDQFSQFIITTILDKLRSPELKLNLSNKQEDIFLAGFSLGGHFAAEMGLNHDDKIGNILLLSPAMNNNQGKLIEEFRERERKNIRIYLSIGQFEDRIPHDPLVLPESRLAINRRFEEVLKEKNYNVTYEELPFGHSELMSVECILHGIEQCTQPEEELQESYRNSYN